jgi:hypothetical protein
MLLDHLSDTGRRDSAVREYNRWARAYVAPAVTSSITVRAGLGAFEGNATTAARRAPPGKKKDTMKNTSETIGQAWMRELSLVPVGEKNAGAFDEARKAVLDRNPNLGMDGKALYFAAQGWMAAQQSLPADAKG